MSNFNHKQLLALPHGEADRIIAMGRGLYLKVGRHDKRWFTQYKLAGQRHQFTIGKFPDVSIKQAEATRAQVRLDVLAGRDPQGAMMEARAGRLEAAVRTVEVEGRQWQADNAKRKWAPAYARQLLQRLESHVFPVIGRAPIGEVSRSQVVDLLAACRDKSGAFQADHVRQHLVCMFNDWLDREWVERNPADRLAHRTETPRKQAQPALIDLEALRRALAAVEASGASVVMKLYNRFLALTGVRPSEARLAEWCEFAVPGQWRIPADHMKGRRDRKLPHTVLLSPAAMEVVEVARTLAPAGALYVFPSDNFGQLQHRPLARSSLADVLNRTLGKRVQTAHGYRGSLTTILKRRGHTEEHLNMMLAHDTRGKVFKHYDHSVVLDYAEALAPIWREWAQLLLADAPTAWSLAGLPAPNVLRLAA